MQIFVLSGQSNMSGRGGVVGDKWDGFVPPECHPRPFILRLDSNLRWVEAQEPLHKDIDARKVCGIGPGMVFANRIPSEGKMIGLVPCAIGGTAIDEWEKGSSLYNNMIRRTRAALDGGGVLRAVLWYQGESDIVSHHAANSYGHKLEKFIHDLRADLGLPDLLFIQVAITVGHPAHPQFLEKVREAQLGIRIPNVYCVDAKGLQLKEDNLHLTTEAQVRLGKMLADIYERQPSHFGCDRSINPEDTSIDMCSTKYETSNVFHSSERNEPFYDGTPAEMAYKNNNLSAFDVPNETNKQSTGKKRKLTSRITDLKDVLPQNNKLIITDLQLLEERFMKQHEEYIAMFERKMEKAAMNDQRMICIEEQKLEVWCDFLSSVNLIKQAILKISDSLEKK